MTAQYFSSPSAVSLRQVSFFNHFFSSSVFNKGKVFSLLVLGSQVFTHVDRNLYASSRIFKTVTAQIPLNSVTETSKDTFRESNYVKMTDTIWPTGTGKQN